MSSRKSILLVIGGAAGGAALSTLIMWHLLRPAEAPPDEPSVPAPETEPPPPAPPPVQQDPMPQFDRDISGTCTFAGIVRTPEETPLAGATVGILLQDQPWSAPQPAASARTDREGRFRIQNINGELPITLWTSAPGRAVATIDRPRCGEEQILEPGPGGGMRLIVKQGKNEPAQGAAVHLFGPSLWPPRVGKTDSTGALTVSGLEPGEYGLWVQSGDGLFVSQTPYEIVAGQPQQINVALSRALRRIVRVTDASDNKPISGATVTAADDTVPLLHIATRTDRKGQTEVVCPAKGCTVSVWAEGYLEAQEIAISARSDATVQLNRGGTVSGRVVDRDGVPVAGADIEIIEDLGNDPVPLGGTESERFRDRLQSVAAGRPWMISALEENAYFVGPPTLRLPDTTCADCPTAGPPASDKQGRFTLSGLPLRRIALFATHPDLIPAGRPVPVSLDTADTVTGVQIVLKAGAKAAIRAMDERDVPLLDAQVVVFDDDDRLIRDAQTDTDGYARFSGLPFGARFEISAEDYIARTVRADRKSDKVELSVKLESAGRTIHGRVKDARGFGVGEVVITARLTERGRKQVLTAVTAPDGTFSLDGAGEGRYRISADGGEQGGAQAFDMTFRDDVKLVLDTTTRPAPEPEDAPMIIAPPGWRSDDISEIGGEYSNNGAIGADNLGVVQGGNRTAMSPAPTPAPTPSPAQPLVGTDPQETNRITPYGDADALSVTAPPPGKGGLPISLGGGPGRVTVSRVAPGSRVAAAGLTRGARLLAVNGKPVRGPADAKRALDGPIGTVVMLEVSDSADGSAPYTIIVQRERMP